MASPQPGTRTSVACIYHSTRAAPMRLRTHRFVLAVVTFLACPGALMAQVRPAPAPAAGLAAVEHEAVYKNPSATIVYSFLLPGAGQLYAGETVRGAAILSAFTLGLSTFFVAAGRDTGCRVGTDCRDTFDPMLYTMGGFALAAGSWIYGIIDAPFTARRVNKRHGVIPPPHARIETAVGPSSTGGIALGIRLAF